MKSEKNKDNNPSLFDEIIEIDEVIRSRRRTISIIIESDARIIVRAPLKAPMSDIIEFVRLKRDWINNKQRQIKEQISKKKKKLYLSGEMFIYKGIEYPLSFTDNINFAFKFDGTKFIANIEIKDYIQQVFIKWYRIAAKAHLSKRVKELTELTGLRCNGIKVNSARKRWGSCSSKKVINFSYRLILAPEFVIDYIIIHELTHTVEMNHSIRFWRIVAKHYPNYKKAEKWLKDNSFTQEI